MAAGDLLRFVMIGAGVIILVKTICSLAKRRLKEQFCLLWGLISFLLILAGLFLRPTLWSEYISSEGTVIILIAAGCVIWCLYFLSLQISVLSRKNQELAMQVSLLNQENERILGKINELKEECEPKK